MKRTKSLFAIVLLGFALGGCAEWHIFEQKVGTVYSAVTGATISPQAVLIASNIFDATERTATNYLKLAKCNGAPTGTVSASGTVITGILCRDPVATKAIIPAIRSGRVARGNLQQFFKEHPGQLGPRGLYDALENSIGTLQSIYAQYQIGAV